MGLSVGMKEWSAVVEALGQGQQTLMIRGYPCKYNTFFLYPTFNYFASTRSDPAAFDSRFNTKFVEMARKSGEETTARAKDFFADIKYWAEIDKFIPVSDSNLSRITDHFIWSLDHVQSYKDTCRKGLFIWLMRVHRFPEVLPIGRSPSQSIPNYYLHPQELQTSHSTPILSNDAYNREKENLLSRLTTQDKANMWSP